LDTGQVIKENGHCVGPTIKGVLIKLWAQNFNSFLDTIYRILPLRWRIETSPLHQMSCTSFV